MIALLLRVFAAIVFLALAAQWIDSHAAQWAYGAAAAFVASFVLESPAVAKRVP